MKFQSSEIGFCLGYLLNKSHRQVHILLLHMYIYEHMHLHRYNNGGCEREEQRKAGKVESQKFRIDYSGNTSTMRVPSFLSCAM